MFGRQRLRGGVRAVQLTDVASGKSVVLGTVKQSVLGEVLPPNQIIWRDAFDGILADVIIVWKHNFFAHDVLIRQRPILPEGLNPAMTRIELVKEYVQAPVPFLREQTYRSPGMPDLVDHVVIGFGRMSALRGKAFSIAGGKAMNLGGWRPDDEGVPVVKQWHKLGDGRTFLVESVGWLEAGPYWETLPVIQRAENLSGRETKLADARMWPKKIGISTTREPMKVANLATKPEGFLIDEALSGGVNSFTFLNTQYEIAASFSVGPGNAIFSNGCIIKYGINAYLLLFGNISFPSIGVNPVFTSINDNLIGNPVGTGNPTFSAAQAIWIYFVDFSTTVQNVVIRWAQRGIQYDSNSSNAVHTVQNTVFRDCQTGIYNNLSSVSLTDVKKCDVTTPTQDVNGGITSGTMADDCPDMGFITAWMDSAGSAPIIESKPFSSTDCEVIEGQVGGSGTRKLLRFGVTIHSVGTGHFYGERDHYRRLMSGWKVWDNCHVHCHITDWTKYELFNLDGSPAQGVTGVGKLGWNLYDYTVVCSPGGPVSLFPPFSGDCMNHEMGMSVGFCDQYPRDTTSGQWLDVTNVSPGQYKLRITINYGNKRYEGNYSNNVYEYNPVTIP